MKKREKIEAGGQGDEVNMSGTVGRPRLNFEGSVGSPSGDAPLSLSGEAPHSLPKISTPRSIRNNGRTSPTSPLKLFGKAKKKINEVFVGIAQYVGESSQFLNETSKELELSDRDLVEHVAKYCDRVQRIREIIGRDRMKVAFFGRTSNGKSTVINAMVRTSILPTGMGHTTNCFLQVEGTEEAEPYFIWQGRKEPFSKEAIVERASAISSSKADSNTLMQIYWPKDKCHLLKDDVILVDSPGIDVTSNIDDCIDQVCLDADVFVLVANAESTLMQTEKNFFHKVSSRLSKPNIFILNNRWDSSVLELEDMEPVKQQHMERCVAFLTDELKVEDKHKAEDRVYFVSAREALLQRNDKAKVPRTPGTPGVLLEGHQGRLFEFCNFEKKFEECISHSAVLTKFAQHTDNGKAITKDLSFKLEEVCKNAHSRRDWYNQQFTETQDKLDYTEKQLDILTDETKSNIVQMSDDVEKKVSTALLDEIRRLASLVDEFERPFHPDPLVLNVYKKELHFHLEECISRNLHARCSSFVHQVLDVGQSEISERLSALLPEEARSQTQSVLPARDFEPAYRLDCKNLCADFQEDIRFRFSLGITSLIRRFLGPKGARSVLLGGSDAVPRPLGMTPQTPSNEIGARSTDEQQVLMVMLSQLSGLYSANTIATLSVIGVVTKAAGWRVIAVCGAVYGLVYIYERLTWTNKAKERSFKRQYVDFAAQKLRLIVSMTSANCSYQVKQELQGTFARLAHLVDNTKVEMKSKLLEYEKEGKKMEDIASRGKVLKNKAGFLETEIDSFIKEYLKPDSML